MDFRDYFDMGLSNFRSWIVAFHAIPLLITARAAKIVPSLKVMKKGGSERI